MASIPDDVRRFILTTIPSVPFLEAVLLLHRDQDAAKSGQEIARSLYVSERRGIDLLQALHDAGFVSTVPGEPVRYRFVRDNAQMTAAIDRLAETYAKDLVGVANLIHDSNGKNARRFAEAFRLRGGR